ncbi:hypothetical protein LJ739_07850 [Aestuariibacter halophilus]|uniref:Lantibiotic n=1 Tax=Fluctibacter halophilus TaxID=226011 RepID=A0ABS8G8W5_9ALTE|nr:hypothetical protein [Aestuariibacter halophilus]MCC2616149.1 hypothetical protein [Aestuariibacter halophilus]
MKDQNNTVSVNDTNLEASDELDLFASELDPKLNATAAVAGCASTLGSGTSFSTSGCLCSFGCIACACTATSALQ